ncbi:hypothetical protein [Lonsdalea quercina]|uniref:hypothetical protein n=1 Tax=Lonsdalea quercina TaxID=71657 RepID=UPI0039748830
MKEYSKREIELLLKTDDKEQVTNALLYLTFNISDVPWVLDKIIEMIQSDDEDICGLAITCIGHIARIYGKINKEKVMPVLKRKAKQSKYSGRVEDAIDDINMFT